LQSLSSRLLEEAGFHLEKILKMRLRHDLEDESRGHHGKEEYISIGSNKSHCGD